jgi:hypothetical protein
MNSLDQSRYFELVAKDKNLKIKGTSLYDEKKSEYLELVSYPIILEEQVFDANRFQYIDFIQKYIDGKINCYTFQWDFFDLSHNHGKIHDKLIENLNQSGISSNISFSKDSKAENFSLLVEKMVFLCDPLDDSLREDRFDLEIKKIYSNLEKE